MKQYMIVQQILIIEIILQLSLTLGALRICLTTWKFKSPTKFHLGQPWDKAIRFPWSILFIWVEKQYKKKIIYKVTVTYSCKIAFLLRSQMIFGIITKPPRVFLISVLFYIKSFLNQTKLTKEKLWSSNISELYV